MIKVRLKYLGKRAPVTISNKALSNTIVFGEHPVDVIESDAAWLMDVNPKMFANLGVIEIQDDVVEDVADVVDITEEVQHEVDTRPRFICERCGKEFRVQWSYDRHLKTCKGVEDGDSNKPVQE